MKSKKLKGRKLYSIIETYIIEVKAFRMFPSIKKARKADLISEQFKERIMLAVTNVNGCSLCSYAHTKFALESGMSDTEIQKLLSSDPDVHESIPQDEAAAITFAQHYADTRCKPDKKAWLNIVERYGNEKALGILGFIRIITMGNALGARLSGIVNRVKHQKYDERTTVITSVLYFLGTIITMPFVIIQVLVMNLFRVHLI